MKKIFLASCIMAVAAIAAPNAQPAPVAEPANVAQNAEAKPVADSTAIKADSAATQPAEVAQNTEAKPAADSTAIKADSVATQPADVAQNAEAKPAADSTAIKADSLATQPADVAQNAEAKPVADSTLVKDSIKTEQVVAKAAPKAKKRKKKKMIENAVFTANKIDFDVNADFELEAGKVLWSTEDDDMGDNLETWTGKANFAVLAETDDFKGKIGVAFYPGDLKSDDDNIDKKIKKEELREGTRKRADDYFSLDEAWAMQETDLFSFKVGRWDNTDKSGDYFGGYIDGYMYGFLSTQDPENQLQFGFSPNENMNMYLSFISRSENLDKGDLRLAFNFHGLEGISMLKVQLAYRSNVFDAVYDGDADIKHNASLKANLPLNKQFEIFAEAALMDLSDDLMIPVTGGVAIYTPIVDRIIVEAEYVGNREDHEEFLGDVGKTKHVKDVLGAIYLEKAFTSRFSLSAGFHSYGCTKDYMISGNLVGRIN